MSAILAAMGFKKSLNKHTKLSEEWSDCKEPVKEGITFYCKYVGSSPIEQSSNATMTSHAVQQIMEMTKAKKEKRRSIALHISPTHLIGTLMGDEAEETRENKGKETNKTKKETKKDSKKVVKKEAKKELKIDKSKKTKKPKLEPVKSGEILNSKAAPENGKLEDPVLKEESVKEVFKISIFRIPYCFAEATFDRVVAFVSTNANGGHECHAVKAATRAIAQSIALTISQAFEIAFDRLNNKLGVSPDSTATLPTVNLNSLLDLPPKETATKGESTAAEPMNVSESSETTMQFPKLQIPSFQQPSGGKVESNRKSTCAVQAQSGLQLLINFDEEPKLDFPLIQLTEKSGKSPFDVNDLRNIF